MLANKLQNNVENYGLWQNLALILAYRFTNAISLCKVRGFWWLIYAIWETRFQWILKTSAELGKIPQLCRTVIFRTDRRKSNSLWVSTVFPLLSAKEFGFCLLFLCPIFCGGFFHWLCWIGRLDEGKKNPRKHRRTLLLSRILSGKGIITESPLGGKGEHRAEE